MHEKYEQLASYINLTDEDLSIVIERLQKLHDEYKDNYTDIRLEISHGYDNEVCIKLSGTRPETEEEKSRRLKDEVIYKTQRIEQIKRELKTLEGE